MTPEEIKTLVEKVKKNWLSYVEWSLGKINDDLDKNFFYEKIDKEEDIKYYCTCNFDYGQNQFWFAFETFNFSGRRGANYFKLDKLFGENPDPEDLAKFRELFKSHIIDADFEEKAKDLFLATLLKSPLHNQIDKNVKILDAEAIDVEKNSFYARFWLRASYIKED